ncbi:hypothetical protein K438DRAFT_1991069 [Mycena galopus ATCC 62051]|nr:hypothetical protein K438DRAFT_1991069 [Mycena galopus ATCC 62051]
MLVEVFRACGLGASVATDETLDQTEVFTASHSPAFAPSSWSWAEVEIKDDWIDSVTSPVPVPVAKKDSKGKGKSKSKKAVSVSSLHYPFPVSAESRA